MIQAIARLAAVLLFVASTAGGAADAPLRLLGRTDLAHYKGDFDHFAADVKGNRLFLAGEDMGTLEVFDLATGKHVKTVKGLETPHAIHYLAESDRLVVSDSGDGMTKILDGRTYTVVDAIRLTPGADVMSYDPNTRDVWIVTGGKNATNKLSHTVVAIVDPATGKAKGEVRFDTDFTEAIAFEQEGHRAFINVSGKSYVAVVDKRSRQVIDTWAVREGEANAPMALDEAGKRLFVVTRKPFKLVVIDTDTGKSVASFDAPQRTNELIFDKGNRRLYLTGDDHVAVFQQHGGDRYEELARVPSDKGAKTAIYVPEVNRLYVAVAGKGTTRAGLLAYEVTPAAAVAPRFHRLEAAVTFKSAAPDWDYLSLDPERGNLFIAARADGMMVYDVRRRDFVRTLEDTEGANASVQVPEFDRIYTVNLDGTSTVFELSTLRKLDKIKLGEDADAAFYDPSTRQVAFMRGDSGEITYVDAKSGRVVARLAMPTKKLEASAADGRGYMFTASRDRNSVFKVHVPSHTVVAEYPAGCEEANGMAIDPALRRVFIGCRGKAPVLVVMDTETGRVVARHDIGRGNDGVIFDAETRRIYTSSGVDGNLVIYDQLDADTYKLAEATTTRPYARTMALDPRTKKLYLVTAEGTVDPSRKVNKAPAPFYPNRYFPDTFTLLTYSPR